MATQKTRTTPDPYVVQLEAKIVELQKQRDQIDLLLGLATAELIVRAPDNPLVAGQRQRQSRGVGRVLRDTIVRNVYHYLCDAKGKCHRREFEHLIPDQWKRKWTRLMDEYNLRNPDYRIEHDDAPTSARLYWAK